jgi:hypothetical protein
MSSLTWINLYVKLKILKKEYTMPTKADTTKELLDRFSALEKDVKEIKKKVDLIMPQKPTAPNSKQVLKALQAAKGILPKDFPDGATYISQLRKEMDKEWEKRLHRLGVK